MARNSRITWSPLLFRQVCFLAAVTGMASWRYPVQGVTAALLLALLTLYETNGYVHPSPRPILRGGMPSFQKTLLYLVFFVLGLALAAVATVSSPASSSVPAWVTAAVDPAGGDHHASFSSGVPLEGLVRETEPLSDNRVRLLLESVTTPSEREPLPGLLVLTWRNPPPDLASAGVGRRLSATLRLREIRGFANPGTWDTERYWRDRGAFYRAWSQGDGTRNGKNAPYALEGETSWSWTLRESLRVRTVTNLSVDATPGERPHLTPPAAIILAMLFGDRSFCPPEMLDLVAKATLAHSLALSGMHLGYAAALGYCAIYLLSLVRPSVFLHLPRQKAGLLLAVPASAAYLWVGGAPPSLLRAALMLFFCVALLWMNRPKVLTDSLIWAVVVILLFSPETLYDIRLQLSAVSVAGMAMAAPVLARLASWAEDHGTSSVRAAFYRSWRGPARRVVALLAGMSGISVAAQLAVFPLVLDAFSGTGFWFPLNLVWLPLLSVWVMPLSFAGLFCTALDLGGAASALFWVAEIPCAGLLSLLGWMDASGILVAPVALRPAWPACAGYWLLLLVLPLAAMARGLNRRLLGLTVLGLVLAAAPTLASTLPPRHDTVSLRLLDVGQGQAALITWQGKNGSGRAMIDGGGFSSPTFDLGRSVIASILTDNAPPDLDWVLNSHTDADHLQGLLFPLETFRVKRVGWGPEPSAKKSAVVLRRDAILAARNMRPSLVSAGDVIAFSPDLRLEVAHPAGDADALSTNDAALVVRLVWRDKPLALICGDVEAKGLRRLLQSRHPLEAEILVLPHHGSSGSFSPALYDRVNPALAVASCGYANQYQFPAKRIREALAARGIPLRTTADSGQIAVTWKEDASFTITYGR